MTGSTATVAVASPGSSPRNAGIARDMLETANPARATSATINRLATGDQRRLSGGVARGSAGTVAAGGAGMVRAFLSAPAGATVAGAVGRRLHVAP